MHFLLNSHAFSPIITSYLFYLTLLLSLFSFSPCVKAEVFFKNKASDEVLDVKGGLSNAGTSIGQYHLNYTKAQRFQPVCQQNCAYVLIETATSSTNQPLYLSVKTQPLLNPSITTPTIAPPPIHPSPNPSSITVYAPPTHLTIYNFLISQEARYKDSPASASSAFSHKASYQHWKLVPVPNQQGYYFIQSLAFDTPHYLQPINYQQHAPLTIAPENGEPLQQWFEGSTNPTAPSQLKLSNFIWQAYEIKGNLTWQPTSDNEDGYSVWLSREESPGRFSAPWQLNTIPAKTRQTTFKDSSRHGQGKKHCFYLNVFNKWGNNNSAEVCSIPSEVPINPPPPVGVSKISFTNCHRDYKTVHLWLKDWADPLNWQDLGNWNHQWGNNHCPESNAKIIPLENGHTYTFIAIDCGDQPPNTTQGSCHKLTSDGLKGLSGNGVIFLQVD